MRRSNRNKGAEGGDGRLPWLNGLVREASTVTLANGVELDLLPIELAECDEEDGADDPGGNTEGTEQPGEAVLDVDGGERKVDSGGEGGLELREGHDDGLHANGRLGESVLEGGDGREDLGYTDEDVGTRDNPDVERGRQGQLQIVVGGALRGKIVVAGRGLVDVFLQDGGIKHGKTSDKETRVDTLNRSEVDTTLAEEGVDDVIEDRDEDDDGDRIQVLDEIVGRSVEGHASSNSSEITVDLRVA